MKKAPLPIMDRRDFVKWSGGVAAAASAFPLFPGEFAHADEIEKTGVVPGTRRTLQAACEAQAEGKDPASAEGIMAHMLIRHGLDADYAAVRDARTLEPIDAFDRPARALIAARLGTVRLIDNMAIEAISH